MFKKTSDSGLSATILCSSLILSACGGGGGGSSGSSSSSGGDASTLKAGLYEADIRYVNGTSSQTAVTYLSPTGEFSGCQLVGIEALSVPNASINVFDITYTMSNCNNDNRNGEYSGVGYFIPIKNQQMRVVFATHNGKVAMHFNGAK